jgi:membrane protein implicated in regulation of membrane protease activity
VDGLREFLATILRWLRKWCEFGVLLVHTAIAIPILIVTVCILIILPIAYCIFATFQPTLLALYLFAVLGGVAFYMLTRNESGDAVEPHNGRGIVSEA